MHTYVIFYSIRTRDTKVNHLFVHLNLCIALALGLVIFISGIENAVSNEVAIVILMILLQMPNVYEWTM